MNIIDAFQNPWFLNISVTVLGLVVGSFLNVVILRLPKIMEQAWRQECHQFLEQPISEIKRISLTFPNSSCYSCSVEIKPWHNIPVLSYLLLRGRCANCGELISYRYLSIELITGLLSLAAAINFGPTWMLIGALAIIWSSITLAGIDIDTKLLPDSITLPLLWLGLLANLYGMFTTLESAVIGAIAGYLWLWSIYWIFKLFTGKKGMGFGDFKLLAAFGAWFGWQALPLIVIFSSFAGATIGIVLVITQRQKYETPIPFGPYLAIAGLLTLFFGDQFNQIYFEFIGIMR